MLSVLQFADSDCPFGNFKLFLFNSGMTSFITCSRRAPPTIGKNNKKLYNTFIYWNLSDNYVTGNIGILRYMLKFIIIILYATTAYHVIYWNLSENRVTSQIGIPYYILKFFRLSCFSTIGIYTLLKAEIYLIIMICATSVYHVIY
jgi:hypothetical protein